MARSLNRSILVLAALACGAGADDFEVAALEALEREYSGRSDLCHTAPEVVVEVSGEVLVAYQETSCDVATGAPIGFAYRVRRWQGAAFSDVGLPLPPPAVTQVQPPRLSRSSGKTIVWTGAGEFVWRDGEWIRAR